MIKAYAPLPVVRFEEALEKRIKNVSEKISVIAAVQAPPAFAH